MKNPYVRGVYFPDWALTLGNSDSLKSIKSFDETLFIHISQGVINTNSQWKGKSSLFFIDLFRLFSMFSINFTIVVVKS